MKQLRNVFNRSFLLLFFIVAVVGVTTVTKDCFWAGILAFPLIMLLLKSKLSAPVNVKKYLWPMLQLVSTCVMVYVVFKMEVNFSWDWGQLIKSAYECAKGEEISLISYYARYPNNRFWLTVLTGLFKCVLFFARGASIGACKRVTFLLSVAVVQLTVFIIYQSARLLWSAGKAFFVGCVALLFLPYYLYAQFFYTDIPGVFLIASTVYLYLRCKKTEDPKKQLWLLGAIGALSALIYQVKIMGMVITIAIVIDLILTTDSLKKVKALLVRLAALVLALVCCVLVTNAITEKCVPISDELYNKYEFPYSHWVMMGLKNSGSYNQPDVDFTIRAGDYDEKFDANVSEIRKRIAEKGALGMVEHVLFTKTVRTWGNDNLAGADYVHRYTQNTDSWVYDVLALDGDKAVIRDVYTGIYHIFMLVGILLSAVFAVKNKTFDPLLFCRIALFGLIVFLMIWECNSRYLLIVSPLLLLSSCDGWMKGIRAFRRGRL